MTHDPPPGPPPLPEPQPAPSPETPPDLPPAPSTAAQPPPLPATQSPITPSPITPSPITPSPATPSPDEPLPAYQPPAWPTQPAPTPPAYPSPAFPSPAYPTSAYPSPYPPASGPTGRSGGTDGFAVTSLVLGALGGGLLAVGFGWAALNRIRRTGRPGRGLAIAGIVLSVLWTVVGAVAIGVVVRSSHTVTAPRPTGSGASRSAGPVALTDLQVGDCVSQDLGAADSSTATVVPCTQSHHGEVFHLARATEAGTYPGEPALKSQAEDLCTGAATNNLVSGLPDEAELVYSYPKADGWRSGDRVITCLVNTPASPSTVEMVNAGSQ